MDYESLQFLGIADFDPSEDPNMEFGGYSRVKSVTGKDLAVTEKVHCIMNSVNNKLYIIIDGKWREITREITESMYSVREQLYDEVERFYSKITSNEPIALGDELDKFIFKLQGIRNQI